MIETKNQKELDVNLLKQRLNASNEQRLELIVKLGEMINNITNQTENDLTPLHQLSDQLLNLDMEIYELLCTVNESFAKCEDCLECQASGKYEV